jgi:chemotaxis protein methyltransferase CheR
MNDRDCVVLLKWALPRLGHRWEGYRRVRRQVCRRIAGRMQLLGLANVDAYRARLEAAPGEWIALGGCLRVTISRFFRDRGMFQALAESLLPRLADGVRQRGERIVRAWSAGCASGEEPYSLSIVWNCALQARCPDMSISILGTDTDDAVLSRAATGCYPPGSLRDVPAEWATAAFVHEDGQFCLRPEQRAPVRFLRQDLCAELPDECFDLILCRNLAFTYFAEPLQRRIAESLRSRLVAGGFLVLGRHEHLPEGVAGLIAWQNDATILRRAEAGSATP